MVDLETRSYPAEHFLWLPDQHPGNSSLLERKALQGDQDNARRQPGECDSRQHGLP